MSETSDLEAKLNTQQADYLKRLETAGQLPTVISDAWNQADNGQTAALRTEEADALKKYVSAGAEARQKYSDVWDPFKRDTLASQQVALNYAPIADVRKELAMRADALGIATSAAVSTYNAETNKAQTAMGFTSDAYNRALERERAAEDQAYKAATLAKSGSSSSSKAEDKLANAVTSDLKDAVSKGFAGKQIAIHGEEIDNQDQYMTREDLIRKLAQAYPDVNTDWIADQVYNGYFKG